jgi:adenine phosphoribosyltransferase
MAIDAMAHQYVGRHIDLVVGRGTGFTSPRPRLYSQHWVDSLRKPGNSFLTHRMSYNLNTAARVEIHRDAIKPGQRVIIVDDLLATGGKCGPRSTS